MPRHAWIMTRGWVGAYLAVSILAVAYPLAVGGRAMGRQPWGILGLAFLCLLMLSCSLLFVRSVTRLRQHVTEVGALVCPNCGHDLRGVPEPGRCPECGREFTLEQLRENWRRFLPR